MFAISLVKEPAPGKAGNRLRLLKKACFLHKHEKMKFAIS